MNIQSIKDISDGTSLYENIKQSIQRSDQAIHRRINESNLIIDGKINGVRNLVDQNSNNLLTSAQNLDRLEKYIDLTKENVQKRLIDKENEVQSLVTTMNDRKVDVDSRFDSISHDLVDHKKKSDTATSQAFNFLQNQLQFEKKKIIEVLEQKESTSNANFERIGNDIGNAAKITDVNTLKDYLANKFLTNEKYVDDNLKALSTAATDHKVEVDSRFDNISLNIVESKKQSDTAIGQAFNFLQDQIQFEKVKMIEVLELTESSYNSTLRRMDYEMGKAAKITEVNRLENYLANKILTNEKYVNEHIDTYSNQIKFYNLELDSIKSAHSELEENFNQLKKIMIYTASTAGVLFISFIVSLIILCVKQKQGTKLITNPTFNHANYDL